MKYTTSWFVLKAKEIHKELYDYSESHYTTSHTKVVIKCNRCLSVFHMTPSNHLHKTKAQGCPVCAQAKSSERIGKYSKDNFTGASLIKPLVQEEYATKVIKDLGMRQLKGRSMRYVELECTVCLMPFEISCDNAKRRQEHICVQCKKSDIKIACVCKGCSKKHSNLKSKLVGNPSLYNLCVACKLLENGIVTTIKLEGFTLTNITKYLYIKDGIVYKKLDNEAVSLEQSRPRIYTCKCYYTVIAYALYYGEINNTVARIDSSRPYFKSNLQKDVNFGGFKVNKPGVLYYLKVGNGTAYKIGITNRSVDKRFTLQDLQSVRVLKVWKFQDGLACRSEEQRILQTYKDYKYQGPPLLTSGNSELFYKDILGLDND